MIVKVTQKNFALTLPLKEASGPEPLKCPPKGNLAVEFRGFLFNLIIQKQTKNQMIKQQKPN